uniref:Late embryogenesis abundant protein n=1 Tax=Solibacter usitatus (strain Ellin6076) TaxID=234267 RepID=Q01ZF0_SOLUE
MFDGPETLEEQFEGDGTVQKVKSAVSDAAEKAQQKAGQAGRAVQDKIDENRGAAADKLQSVAATLQEKADSLPGGEKVASLAHNAADKVEATAQYVREHDVQGMMADLETLVRRHPAQSLAAAAAVGFLLGRALRSDDWS